MVKETPQSSQRTRQNTGVQRRAFWEKRVHHRERREHREELFGKNQCTTENAENTEKSFLGKTSAPQRTQRTQRRAFWEKPVHHRAHREHREELCWEKPVHHRERGEHREELFGKNECTTENTEKGLGGEKQKNRGHRESLNKNLCGLSELCGKKFRQSGLAKI